MGIGLTIFGFILSVVAICAAAAFGVRHALFAYLSEDEIFRQEHRKRLLLMVRAGLVLAGGLVLLTGFIALPALFHREASPATARVVPILQFLAFICLVGMSLVTEYLLRRPDGEGHALWHLAGRVALLEGSALLAGLAVAAAILLLPRWGLAHFGKLRLWDPYFVMPLSLLAVAAAIVTRALALPHAIRLLFVTTPLEGAPAQAIQRAHEDFLFPAPTIDRLPPDGTGRVSANRRGLFGRFYGVKQEHVFVTAELCERLSADELDALSRREVAHGVLHTALRRLARLVMLGEALLIASWLYPKLQVPLAVIFGLDARFVRMWVPVIGIALCAYLAIRGWLVASEDDERRADLYAVEVLGADLTALTHGLRKVFSGTVAEDRALDRRLAALDESLRVPQPVRVLDHEEREAIALHYRRVGFGFAGGFALVLLGIGLSPYGQRTVMQWRISLAIRAHDTRAVAQLLQKGASPNRENLFGVSPVSAAAGAGDLDLLKELINHGGAVQNENWPKQPLHEAASRGRLDIISYLLEKGAQVNATDFYGRTALMVAASNGRRSTVEYLLQHGARLNARDQSGRTALQLAESRGDREIAHTLRRANAR